MFLNSESVVQTSGLFSVRGERQTYRGAGVVKMYIYGLVMSDEATRTLTVDASSLAASTTGDRNPAVTAYSRGG